MHLHKTKIACNIHKTNYDSQIGPVSLLRIKAQFRHRDIFTYTLTCALWRPG